MRSPCNESLSATAVESICIPSIHAWMILILLHNDYTSTQYMKGERPPRVQCNAYLHRIFNGIVGDTNITDVTYYSYFPCSIVCSMHGYAWHGSAWAYGWILNFDGVWTDDNKADAADGRWSGRAICFLFPILHHCTFFKFCPNC